MRSPAAVFSLTIASAIAVTMPHSHALGQWTDVATADVQAIGLIGRGVCWGDYNQDGRLDFILANHLGPALLLVQDAAGSFSLAGGGDLALLADDIQQPVSADPDNDGDLDLFICGSSRSYLFRNNGPDGQGGVDFELISPGTNLQQESVLARGAAWADFDADGILDLYVSSNGQGNDHEEDKIFRGLGDLTYADVSPPFFMTHSIGRGVACSDYDNDGDIDIYSANGFGCPCEPTDPYPEHTEKIRNRMYRNNGDGTFLEVTDPPIDDIDSARGCCFGDIDNDGDLDLFIANLRVNGQGGFNKLLRNDGPPPEQPEAPPRFVDITTTALADRGTHRSCAFVDVDNDADLDLHVTALNDARPMRLYLNDGAGGFTMVSSGLATAAGFGAGAAWADYDRDGDMDVALIWNVPPGNRLLRNDLDDARSWLVVELTGAQSNRSAIGARITVMADVHGDGTSVRQIREVEAGSGYLSQHMHAVHFGLGHAGAIDVLQIRWPSGAVREYRDVAPRQLLRLQEIPCIADFDENAIIDSQDYFEFLNALFGGEPADVNDDGASDSQDYFDYLNAFASGC